MLSIHIRQTLVLRLFYYDNPLNIPKINIKQYDITDFGAACLASISAYYKLETPIACRRQYASTDKKGTIELRLLESAKKLGCLKASCFSYSLKSAIFKS